MMKRCRPPEHYNPEPMFGLRVSPWRWLPDKDAFEWSMNYVSLTNYRYVFVDEP